LAISGLVLRHNPKPFLALVFRDAMSMADRDRRDTERDRLRRRRNKERMREQRASEMGGEGWLDELLAVDAWETGVAAAVSSGATECAVALVHKAPVGSVRSGHGSDLLYRACERGQPAVADALLVLGADANATDGTGRGDTALMVASGGGTTGLDMRAMHGRYWSNLGNDLQGRPRAADQQGITGRFNAVEPKMEGTPHTGRSDAGHSNSADLEVGTKCAAELSTSSCGADDAWDGVATGAALLDDIAEGVPARRATTGFADCVKLLLTAGADPLRRDKLEWAALMHACSVRQCDYDCELCRDHTEIVAKVLLAAGASASEAGRSVWRDQGSALFLAAANGHAGAEEVLRSAGAGEQAERGCDYFRNGMLASDTDDWKAATMAAEKRSKELLAEREAQDAARDMQGLERCVAAGGAARLLQARARRHASAGLAAGGIVPSFHWRWPDGRGTTGRPGSGTGATPRTRRRSKRCEPCSSGARRTRPSRARPGLELALELAPRRAPLGMP
jgi:hypothetical protein